MKKIFKKILEKVFKKAVQKAANAEVTATDPEESGTNPYGDNKKAIWKFIIQTLISILTAILTALGTTSCMGVH